MFQRCIQRLLSSHSQLTSLSSAMTNPHCRILSFLPYLPFQHVRPDQGGVRKPKKKARFSFTGSIKFFQAGKLFSPKLDPQFIWRREKSGTHGDTLSSLPDAFVSAMQYLQAGAPKPLFRLRDIFRQSLLAKCVRLYIS